MRAYLPWMDTLSSINELRLGAALQQEVAVGKATDHALLKRLDW